MREDSVYFINPETEFLCQLNYGEMQEIALTSEEVEKYFFSDEYIYYQLSYDNRELKRLCLSDGYKKVITNKEIARLRFFDMILDEKIMFNCENGKLTYVECGTGKEKLIKLKGD